VDVSRSRPPTTDDGPPKTLLICPDCGHESHLGGDWRTHLEPTVEGTVRVSLGPVCDGEIARRPA
jgi:hypothetical protein